MKEYGPYINPIYYQEEYNYKNNRVYIVAHSYGEFMGPQKDTRILGVIENRSEYKYVPFEGNYYNLSWDRQIIPAITAIKHFLEETIDDGR